MDAQTAPVVRRPAARIEPLNLWLVDPAIDAGFALFTTKPDKAPSPFYPSGFRGAHRDRDRLKWELRRRPDDMLGIPTNGFGIVDIDRGPTGSVRETLAALRHALNDTLPLDLVMRTRSGGAHVPIDHTPGVPFRTTQDDPVEGVDLRGHTADGAATGYVIAPGCRHPAGGEWGFWRGTFNDFLARRFAKPSRELHLVVSLKKAGRGLIAANPELAATIAGADPERWPDIIADFRRSEDRGDILLADTEADALRLMGVHDLNLQCEAVRSLNTGRRGALWRAACCLARFVANGALTAGEVTARLSSAFVAAAGPGGEAYARGCISRALALGSNDPAPLIPRVFREEAAKAAKAAEAAKKGSADACKRGVRDPLPPLHRQFRDVPCEGARP